MLEIRAMSKPAAGSLKQRVFTASSFTLAGYALGQLLRFAGNLIMTRLLMPEMFGVMAIAILIIVGLAMFSDLGLRQNVVQSEHGEDHQFLNTAWVLQIIRGGVLSCLGLVVGMSLALANHLVIIPEHSVYGDPVLPYVIVILSIGTFIQGFESTKVLQASRRLVLKQVVLMELGSQVIGLISMLLWVRLDSSIWALVAASIAATVSRVTISHIWLSGTNNSFQWSPAACREIVGFGKWIFLSSILGFLVNSGDRLMLAGLVSSHWLGIYVIAYLIVNAVEQVITKLIADVCFPALGEVARGRLSELKFTYYRLHAVIASFAYFAAGLLVTSGQALVRFLYDARYADAGWMLQVLAFGLLTLPFHLATQSFIALGMPKLLSAIILVRLAALLCFIPIGFATFGLQGGLWAIVVAYFSWLPMTIAYMLRFHFFDVRREMIVLPAVLVGGLAGKVIALTLGN
jgi:O-antigen/teichoic acid export membrane protein